MCSTKEPKIRRLRGPTVKCGLAATVATRWSWSVTRISLGSEVPTTITVIPTTFTIPSSRVRVRSVAVDPSSERALGRRPVRLKDIAERAGVSIKTASNALNGLPHVRESTRERVLALADELGYRPNLSARGLKK